MLRQVAFGAPRPALLACSRLMGRVLHDVLLTTEEYDAMAAGLADTHGEATGRTQLSAWLSEDAATLGTSYANELARHF